MFTRSGLGDWSCNASGLAEGIDQVNTHKDARLTWQGRRLLVERVAQMGLAAAANAAGVSLRTARKWLARYEAAGEDGLVDRSSRPLRTRNSIDAELAERIEGIRRSRMPVRRIAAVVGRSVATISRFVASLGLSSLSALEPAKPVVRYEHEAPGELLHIDTKKLGRIVRPSHRVTGDRRDSVEGAGWEFAHVAIGTGCSLADDAAVIGAGGGVGATATGTTGGRCIDRQEGTATPTRPASPNLAAQSNDAGLWCLAISLARSWTVCSLTTLAIVSGLPSSTDLSIAWNSWSFLITDSTPGTFAFGSLGRLIRAPLDTSTRLRSVGLIVKPIRVGSLIAPEFRKRLRMVMCLWFCCIGEGTP